MFVDSSGWATYVDNRQLFHAQAVQDMHDAWQQGRKVVTTSYVLTELTALLNRPLRMPRHQQIQFLDSIHNNPFVDVEFVDVARDQAAWRLWKARADKEWTLVDCVVMQQCGLTEALTTDHHFEQAGFLRLLK